MTHRKKVEWTRLDNASKIFPATYTDHDTKVFRLSCELHEEVQADLLQEAADSTLENFPLFKSVLRRGIFWYYLEESELRPEVTEEALPVCAPIYFKDQKNLLFRVFYYQKRINLEVFHALADGTGALWFLQNLIYNYLTLRYGLEFSEGKPGLHEGASLSQKKDDSFGRYFSGGNSLGSMANLQLKQKKTKAYHVKGSRTEENRMNLLEGSMAVKDLLQEVHQYDTTLTNYIVSLFAYSIYKEMPADKKDKTVIISVPINLRQIFSSETARNFFSTLKVGYNFNKDKVELEDVIQGVKEQLATQLTEDNIKLKLNKQISLEKNLLVKILVLPVKDWIMRLGNMINNREITVAISNMGKITMPKAMEHYISQFSACTSARRPQLVCCTYGDKLVISFTSPFLETEIQRTFFRYLAQKGIDIVISANH